MSHDDTPEGEFCPDCGQVHQPKEELERRRKAAMERAVKETSDAMKNAVPAMVGAMEEAQIAAFRRDAALHIYVELLRAEQEDANENRITEMAPPEKLADLAVRQADILIERLQKKTSGGKA